MMSTMSRMSALIVVADLIEENAQLKARVAELEDEAVKLVSRIGEMKLPSIDESNIASVKADLSIERARVETLKTERYEITCAIRGEIGKVLRAMNVAHRQLVGGSGLEAFVSRLQDEVRPPDRAAHRGEGGS